MVINVDALTNGVNFHEFGSRLPRIPVASAISGLIVAALILMTPNPWFESFIVQTGLPELVASAQPPLGAKARIVFALIAALVVTGGAWLALNLLLGNLRGGRSVPPFVEPDEDEGAGRAFDFLRRRRADSHPDAPPRRPIFAADDLGAPLDLVDIAPEEEEEGAQPNENAEEADEAFELSREDFAAQRGFELAAEATEESTGSESLFTIPLRGADGADDENIGAEVVEPAEPRAAEPDDWKEPAPGFEVRAELAELVNRLEAGLARRRARLERQRQAAAVPADAPAGGNGNLDGALREALDALQKLEVRGA